MTLTSLAQAAVNGGSIGGALADNLFMGLASTTLFGSIARAEVKAVELEGRVPLTWKTAATVGQKALVGAKVGAVIPHTPQGVLAGRTRPRSRGWWSQGDLSQWEDRAHVCRGVAGMIDWRSLAELDSYLKAFSPSGLSLSAKFHALTDEDLHARIARSPEAYIEEGLHTASAWCGLIERVPFVLLSAPRPAGFGLTGYGLEVRLPVCAENDGLMFDALAKLPLPALRPASPLFEVFHAGRFGVAAVGGREPIYSSALRDDALAAIQLLNRWTLESYDLIEVEPREQWLVVGPSAGPFISRVEMVGDELTAQRIANKLSIERGVTFTVARSC